MGIDLGTANTLICSKTAGIILREPSVVAVHKKTGKVIAVGSNAYRMIGRTPEYLTTVHPLKDGVIADFDMARIMLHAFLKKALRGRSFVHPRFVISIPCGVTAVERRAVIDTAIQAGGREAFLIEAPLAAAMGAGMFIREAAGNMVVDIGGGTTEAAVISLGSIVQSRTLRIGGNRLDEALVRYIKRKYNLLISLPMAEMMKVEIGDHSGNYTAGFYGSQRPGSRFRTAQNADHQSKPGDSGTGRYSPGNRGCCENNNRANTSGTGFGYHGSGNCSYRRDSTFA
jgi:rod shape-determining protein MreB